MRILRRRVSVKLRQRSCEPDISSLRVAISALIPATPSMATAQATIRMTLLPGQRHRNTQSQSKLAQFSQRDPHLEGESQPVVCSWSSEMRDGAPQARAMPDNIPRI